MINSQKPHQSSFKGTRANDVTVCDIIVSTSPHPKSDMEPPVFHMQHTSKSSFEASKPGRGGEVGPVPLASQACLATAVLLGALSANTALAKDKPCINYYSVGESDCKPAASTPVTKVQTVSGPPVVTAAEQSEVDKYLANYGKPPREFVEFYLNPTPENATKWVAAYQQLLQKGQDISKAWSQADQLYKGQPGVSTPSLQSPLSISPPVEAPPAPVQTPAPVIQAPAQSFGAFAERAAMVRNSTGGVAQPSTLLTYYFSQTCPYCARATPDLSVISNEIGGKLAFTCVDVTPVGPEIRPNESYITSKLPCKWRLPEEGEVERESVRQTPTLVIQKAGQSPVRLSGYVPLAQLRSYF